MNEEIEKKQTELKNEIYEDLKKYLQENVLLSVIKQDRNADCVKIKTINNRIKEG